MDALAAAGNSQEAREWLNEIQHSQYFGCLQGQLSTEQLLSLPVPMIGMLVTRVLPPADRAFDPTMLSVDFFLANIPKERANVEITIPKWHIKENDLKLKSMCESLGIHKMFTLHADTVASDQLSRSYHISDFYQKTNILVNGEGTRASVVSVMEGEMAGGVALDPIPSVEFRADRPFFYAIYNRRSGVIDFIGYLVDPEYDGEDNFTGCTTVRHRFEEKDLLY